VTFRADIRQWRDGVEFRRHLAAYSPSVCGWVQNVILHHTVKPLAPQWRGRRSMAALVRYYTSLGWDSGPHLFLVHGAPDYRDNGIWQLTALNERGIHAGTCNAHSIGVEVVGDFDRYGYPPLVERLVVDTVASFLVWRGLQPSAIAGHRDCGSPKTCPGRAVSLPVVRSLVAQRMPEVWR
jgi:hypothetical protein